MKRLFIKNIGLLATGTGSNFAGGTSQGHVREIPNASILCEDGVISKIWEKGEGPGDNAFSAADTDVFDCGGHLVTPGLVDAHTHLVFGGYRQKEVPLKLEGAGYMDILKAGGGILDTVRETRKATFDELYNKSRLFLDEMLGLGITCCEIKSGYGLSLADEIKQLEVIKKLGKDHAMDIVATFMGAHALPTEYGGRSDEYIDFLCDGLLPAVKDKGLAEFCDVFCEEGVFTIGQSERYMAKAADLGFKLKIHADELKDTGGAELAARKGALSAEHLIAAGDKGLDAMAQAGTCAVLLPATSFYLDKPFARARTMIEKGIPVALASDFNPGSCPSLNLQFIINLAYLRYKMTPKEILTAVTLNGACALGQGSQRGTAEPGKQADLVVWKAEDLEMLCYRFGSNLAKAVIKHGGVWYA